MRNLGLVCGVVVVVGLVGCGAKKGGGGGLAGTAAPQVSAAVTPTAGPVSALPIPTAPVATTPVAPLAPFVPAIPAPTGPAGPVTVYPTPTPVIPIPTAPIVVTPQPTPPTLTPQPPVVILPVAPQMVEFRVGSAKGVGTTTVSVEVANAALAALTVVQADVTYDETAVRFDRAWDGAGALIAGKRLTVHEVRPGLLRLMVAGLDNTQIGDGVVADLVFSSKAGLGAAGASDLGVRSPELVDDGARLVAAVVKGGRVEVQ